MLHRRLLLTLPAMTTLLVIVVLLGPGQPRAVVGLRALGVVQSDGAVRSLRLVAIRREASREETIAGRELTLFVDDAETWKGTTDASGTAEVAFSAGVPPGARVRVADRESGVVLDGLLGGAAAEVVPGSRGWLAGRSTGELTIAAQLVRGAVVPPFPARVRVFAGQNLFDHGEFQSSQQLSGRAEITVRGGEPTTAKLAVGPDQPSELEVTPIAEPLEIEIDFRADDGRTGHLAATAPIVMGGFAVTDGADVAIASQAPRPVAFASFYEGNVRMSGATVPLTEAPSGFFEGRTARPPGATAIVVASDPSERGLSTVVWPLGQEVGVPSHGTLTELAEGLTLTSNLERQRLRTVRGATVGMLAIAALAEIVLLLIVGRARRLAGDRVPVEENAPGTAPDSPGGAMRIAKNAGSTLALALATALLLLLAFASIAGLAVLRD